MSIDRLAVGKLSYRPVVGVLALWAAVQAVSLALSLHGLSSQAYLYKQFLTFNLTGADSWGPMNAAFEWLSENDAGSVHQSIFFEAKTKFQYPLTSLLIYYPLKAATSDWIAALNLVGWLCVVLQALITAFIADDLVRRRAADTPDRLRWLAAATAALVTITFYPVMRGFGLGQVQVWLNTLFLLACACWLRGRFAWSGVLIGAACLFKPQLGLFLVWAALRRNWSFAGGIVAIALPAGLVSLALFGLQNNLDYLHVLSFISRHGEVFLANQSINGLLNRLVTAEDSRVWASENFAPYDAVVHGLTFASALGFMAWGLLFRRKADPAGWTPFLLAALAFTLASPVAWEHHYGFVTVAMALVFVDAALAPPSRWRTARLAALALAYALTGQDLFGAAIAFLPMNSVAASFFLFAVGALFALLATTPRSTAPERGAAGVVAA